MTAVRLRGNAYKERAIEVHQRNKQGETLTELANEYECSREAIRQWAKEGRKHDHPPLEDRHAWLDYLTNELASRVPEANDADATRLAKQVGEWLGLAHADRQRDAMLMMERERLDMLHEMATRLGVDTDPAVVKVLEA